MARRQTNRPGFFDRFAGAAAERTGRPWAFTLEVLVLVTWAISGPVFGGAGRRA